MPGSATWFRDADKALVDHLYRSRTTVKRNPALKLAARFGESAEEFAARRQAAADEARTRPRSLQQRYEARIAKARTALDSAADRVEQARAAQQTRRSNEIVEGAGSIAGRRARRAPQRLHDGLAVGRGVTGRSQCEASQRVETARNCG